MTEQSDYKVVRTRGFRGYVNVFDDTRFMPIVPRNGNIRSGKNEFSEKKKISWLMKRMSMNHISLEGKKIAYLRWAPLCTGVSAPCWVNVF